MLGFLSYFQSEDKRLFRFAVCVGLGSFAAGKGIRETIKKCGSILPSRLT